MKRTNKNFGSALIMTVVLTSLLSIVAVMFVMLARVDKMSTSAIAENKQLNLAVDSVVARICDELVRDVPSLLLGEEYYDYPDPANRWLASLEPYDRNPAPDVNDYRWRRISDIYQLPGLTIGMLEGLQIAGWVDDTGLFAGPDDLAVSIISENDAVTFAHEPGNPQNNLGYGGSADADGDGVADSRWVPVPDMTSKARDIYTAVRVVDNGAMLNVNTGHKFEFRPNDPTITADQIDGSSQMHINLMALSWRQGVSPYDPSKETDLLQARANYGTGGIDPLNLAGYKKNVVWCYNKPNGSYTPFDISDELELRNRFLLNHESIDTRLEAWGGQWRPNFELSTPVDLSGTPAQVAENFDKWFYRTQHDVQGPNDIYSYRHIGTTYNMDRIIDPNGDKMFGINTDPNAGQLYQKLLSSIDPAMPVAAADFLRTEFAQIAANIKDYGDSDSQVSIVGAAYGFERPCIYISELAYHYLLEQKKMGSPRPPEHISYAIELRQRYWGTNSDQWRVVITGPYNDDAIDVTDFSNSRNRYRVIVFEDPCASLAETVVYSDSPADGETGVDPNVTLSWPKLPGADPNCSYDVYFGTDQNSVRDATSTVDPNGDYQGPQDYNNTSYYPGPLDTSTPYFWRIDDVYDGNVVSSIDVWQFTTWAAEPNSIYDIIGPNSPRIFDVGTVVGLERILPDGTFLRVDEKIVPPVMLPPVGQKPPIAPEPPLEINASVKRDVSGGLWIKRIWDDVTPQTPSLGNSTGHYFSADPNPIQARPANRFRNVGEIGLVLRKSAYLNDLLINPLNVIGPLDSEFSARLNLADPNVQQFFRYLTRFDPSLDGINNDGDNLGGSNLVDESNPNLTPEFKIPGRININTAPWYVIAQLPWVSPHTPNYDLARAIADYRDISGPFTSIGELNRIVDPNTHRSINYYGRSDGSAVGDQLTYPDLTAGGGRSLGDGYADDFEERDLIFARISDLVTVRSDVFTAYILVRIGTDGPQKRVIAILDRSDAYSTNGRVKVRALHPVPDPR